MKHIRLFSTDQKLFVECNEKPMPEKTKWVDREGIDHDWRECIDNPKYLKWQKSCKTVEVHPSEANKLLQWLFSKGYDTFAHNLQQGIMLPPDSVIIKIKHKLTPRSGNWPKSEEIEYAFLSEESSETQEPTDSQMLDWIQEMMTDNDNYCEIFFAGLRSFEDKSASAFQIESNPEKFETTNAPTIREAIKKAMNEIKMKQK